MSPTSWTEQTVDATTWIPGTPQVGTQEYIVVGGAIQPVMADTLAVWIEETLSATTWTEESAPTTSWTELSA